MLPEYLGNHTPQEMLPSISEIDIWLKAYYYIIVMTASPAFELGDNFNWSTRIWQNVSDLKILNI